jgi:predicted metal-dependent enzyme (double-stranded beta helix superfamily)
MSVFEIEQFVSDCRAALRETQPSLAVMELMERTVSDDRSLLKALGEPTRADLTVLHSAPDLTVLHGVWAPQMRLYPHNHNMWAVIGIYGGQEDNTFWRRGQEGLSQRGGRELREHEVVVLGSEVIHSVSNPLRAYTAAVHVYAGDYLNAERSEWDPETLAERPFDFDHARTVFAEADEAWLQEQAMERARS